MKVTHFKTESRNHITSLCTDGSRLKWICSLCCICWCLKGITKSACYFLLSNRNRCCNVSCKIITSKSVIYNYNSLNMHILYWLLRSFYIECNGVYLHTVHSAVDRSSSVTVTRLAYINWSGITVLEPEKPTYTLLTVLTW